MGVHFRRSWLVPAISATAILVFAFDSLTRRGVADYIFYFVPVALSAFAVGVHVPLRVAALTTFLAGAGFWLSPAGDNFELLLMNRIMAVVVVWTVAFLARQVISARNRSEEQAWVQGGVAQLSLETRGEKTPEQVATIALRFLADYARAEVGAFYLRSDEGLSRIGTYGFSSGTGSPARFAMGEGLVGQCALEEKPISLSPAPTGYLQVRSGLGGSDPAHIRIVPLCADEDLQGVMELGFFRAPGPATESLLDYLGEMLGMVIRSSHYRARLTEMLTLSQQHAEELQAQQEELRVVNEELEQQTKALRESQGRLENQQAELEQTNQQLEEQAQLLESQKADLDERNDRLRTIQHSLQEKAQDLEKASRYKSEFLANMSHELRTPLNSSLILAKLLADNRAGNLSSEQIKYAETIYGAGNDLLHIINDVLDLSKVEAGKLEIRPEEVTVSSVLSDIERAIRPMAEQKGLKFRLHREGDIPENIVTDRVRLEQVLKNFLSNAVKFTEKGEVELKVSRMGDRIAFAVRDTGIGIPANQLDLVFEAFQQIDGTTNRRYGGTGLGLSISRELSKLLGGEIDAQSEVGKGSTFTFIVPQDLNTVSDEVKLPASAPSSPAWALEIEAPPEIPAPKVNGQAPSRFSFEDDREISSEGERKLLIIEDDETFAKILLDLAREMGFKAIVTPSGEAGITLATQHAPTAILLDVRLPDFSGLAVLDAFKSNPKLRHIPVHVISGEDFAKAAYQMGAIGYMLKPVTRDRLIEAFHQIEAKLEQKLDRVLIVEDDPVQRESMAQLIGDQRVETITTSSAKQAIELLSKQTFDCMIMDLNLPEMSGFELLETLAKCDQAYSHPPIIIYTGRDLTSEEEQKLRRYSDSIIIKGARSPERLLTEVTLFLHRVESQLPLERQRMLKEIRSREKTLAERRILVVDDDVRNIFALTSLLEPQGADVVIARDGKEALEKLASNPDVDLVLMDIMMPEMDGYTAMKEIRNQRRFEKLPIIALTAKAMRDDQEKCLQAGANDYLAKPIDVDKLLSLVRVWMPSSRSF